jgi:fatty acid desaturase
MLTQAASLINSDQEALRNDLMSNSIAYSALCQPATWRSMRDVLFDWFVVLGSVVALHFFGWWLTPFTLFIVGNRQRALGNLLHDAGHCNLSGLRWVNDAIAIVFLAPPLFNSLNAYREMHARHHAWLGDPERDPDFIPRPDAPHGQWYLAYWHCLSDLAIWRSSILGNVYGTRLAFGQWLAILAWWAVVLAALALVTSIRFSLLFLALWIGAKATIFHAITTFRELTDHYGLEPGGIFSFTRDIPAHGLLSQVIHPHNNGYHLTHHLIPSIPYHRLPDAHTRLSRVATYGKRATVCDAYLHGSCAGIHGWGGDSDER